MKKLDTPEQTNKEIANTTSLWLASAQYRDFFLGAAAFSVYRRRKGMVVVSSGKVMKPENKT